MTTRRAMPRDLPGLLAARAGTGSDFGRRRLREAIGRGAVHLRTDGRQVVAWGVMARTFFGRPFIEVLWVAPAHRRAGHGEALLAWIETRAGAREEIWTSTNRSNRPMRRLLRKRGFVLKGHVSGLDDGDPELFYVKAPRGQRR